ncbi:MAG: hypothetical protein NDJ75_07425 [Thermoanaerobaculia bacterium]|nr:hypothetical protein [Thermoanaerobaculia bacterium]
MNSHRWWAVALVAAAWTLPFVGVVRAEAALPAGRSCADCCKLPCIEAQLWEARYRRFVYEKMSKIKNLDKAGYEKRQAEMEQLSSFMRAMYVGQNTSCNGWVPKDPQEGQVLGTAHSIGIEWGKEGVDKINYTLSVDPMTCELNKKGGPEVMPKLSACTGMGEAVVDHEKRHIAECLARVAAAKKSGKPLQPPTPAQNADAEVHGYDDEIARLERARKEAAAPCMKDSCKENPKAFDRTARLLGTDLGQLVGKAKKKPPTNSPTRRGKGGS